MWTYFKSLQLIDGKGGSPIPGGVVLAQDGVIVDVGLATQVPIPEGALQVNLSQYTVMPGLIDAHVHLFGTPDPGGFVATQHENEEWLLLRAESNARQALVSGITTVRDCGARGTIIISLAKAIAAGMLLGPRVVSCGAPITTTGGHCYYLGLEAEGVVGVQTAVRKMHKAGADFIKVMVTGGGITRGSNTRASQYSQAELDALVEDAHRLGKKVAGHVHGTEGIRRAVDAGFDTLEHGSWLALNGQGRDYNPRVVENLLRQGTFVCRTIAGFERLPLEEATPDHRFWPDYEVLRNMVRDGVLLAAGTDSGIDQTPITGIAHTLETMGGLGGMTNSAVLDAATRVAAEAIGLGDKVGTLEKGKQADLIAVSGNPLEDLRVLRHVDVVVRDGAIMVQDGYLLLPGSK